METGDLVENAFAMPLTSPSFPCVPYRYRTAAISSSPTTSIGRS
jgi:acetoacetate decarboxylase